MSYLQANRDVPGRSRAEPPGSAEAWDAHWMGHALDAAAQAYGETSPNPMVGALVTLENALIGVGHHRCAGLAHAEPQALEDARRTLHWMRATPEKTGALQRPWTLYVNLEPCAHHGRTPPCVEAIAASPVRRVVAAHPDPDPRVSGRGAQFLRRHGIRVDFGCGSSSALELNHVFVARQLRGRPFIALKVALSADGCVAAADGSPVAITGFEARRHAHGLRAGLDAILVGVETLRSDRPRLDRRLHTGPGRLPRRLVIDPDLRAEPAWLWPGERLPVLFCDRQALDRRGRVLAAASELVALPRGPQGLDLAALPEALAELGITSVLVEGGGRTHRAFLEAGLWDRLYRYRNLQMKLDGLPWVASEVWERERPHGEPFRHAQLGADDLEIFVHPASQVRA